MNWKDGFMEKHPRPVFTFSNGAYRANGKIIMRTCSTGPTTALPETLELAQVPEYVVGAYCALEGIMFANFCMVHLYPISVR